MLSIAQLKAISGCANITPGAARGSFEGPSPVSQERSLPTELWVHALEYTSWDDANAAFEVSKSFRSASRFALTKGRWAPVMKVVLDVKSFPWHRHGFARKSHLDYNTAEFCAAWHVREPRLLRQIMDNVDQYRCADMERVLGALLHAAEPAISDDALARIVATLEHVEAKVPRGEPFTSNIFEEWWLRVPGARGSSPLPPFLASNDWVPRLFHAAERCVSGHHAGNVLYGVLFHLLDDAAEFETEAAVQRMTAGWSDEHKRDELVAVFRRAEHQIKADERQRRDEEEFREIREMERIAGGW